MKNRRIAFMEICRIYGYSCSPLFVIVVQGRNKEDKTRLNEHLQPDQLQDKDCEEGYRNSKTEDVWNESSVPSLLTKNKKVMKI